MYLNPFKFTIEKCIEGEVFEIIEKYRTDNNESLWWEGEDCYKIIHNNKVVALISILLYEENGQIYFTISSFEVFEKRKKIGTNIIYQMMHDNKQMISQILKLSNFDKTYVDGILNTDPLFIQLQAKNYRSQKFWERCGFKEYDEDKDTGFLSLYLKAN